MSPPTPARRVRRVVLAMFASAALAAASLTTSATAHAATTQVKPQVKAAATASVTHACARPARPDQMACLSLVRTDVAKHKGIQPNAAPSGYGPSDLKNAYALPSGGSGQTVAIVDAYDDPAAEADLATYRAQYGLTACTTANGCFKKVNETGGSSLPSADSGWAEEISLDLDMVSAVCPNCHILLVEATQSTMGDLGTAVNTAVSLGAKFVSNSYGGPEDSTDPKSDSSYFNHPGVAITVSSGDSGYGAEYPAASQYVTAVGGTTLNAASNARGWTESAWSGAGSGCSAYDAKPSWQKDTGCAKRTVADVSAVADPGTGLAVYDSYQVGGWLVVGGTSASSPIIAGVYALAGTPASGTYPASYPYSHASAVNDVTSGSNGSCPTSYLCKAGAGYDGPTGLGTPNGTTAFGGGSSGGGNTVTVTDPGNQTSTVGTAASLQIRASDSASGQTLTYSATGLPAGLSINASTGLISGTPTTAQTSQVTVTAKDTTNASGSATFTWTVNPVGGGGCSSPGNKVRNGGFESGTAPWSTTAGVVNANGSGESAHSGTHFAWFDGYGFRHTDRATQSVTIPSGCKATLGFYLHIDTRERGSTAYDKFTVNIGGTPLATYSNVNAASGYVHRTFDVSSFAGRTVTLSFSGTEDSSRYTDFVLDDVAVNAS